MSDFFRTLMGQKFYEGTMPRIAKALERIADALEKIAEAENKETEGDEA
jgi:uncharacterized protein YukE